MKPPKPVPSNDPVPFARGSENAVWPVISNNPQRLVVNYVDVDGSGVGDNPGRRFLATRNDGARFHVAIDLFANHTDKVVACEDGRVVSFYTFYSTSAGEEAYALLVEHEGFVANYGEVKGSSQNEFGWTIGGRVTRGQEIARVSTTGMLHFETYEPGTAHNQRWLVGGERPASLLNPTLYLLQLAARAQGVGGPALPPVEGPVGTPLKSAKLAGNADLQAAARGARSYSRGHDTGEAVGLIQDALDLVLPAGDHINAGADRGTFGPRTEVAARKFQQQANVRVDGIVGKNTLRALDDKLLLLEAPGQPAVQPPAGQFINAVALTEPRRVEYFDANHCRQVKFGGTRSWRNNNPGNIICGTFTNSHGAIGCDSNTQPTAAIFPLMDIGRAAQVALLSTSSYQNLTVGGAMDRWTGSNNAGYKQLVQNTTGISMGRQMSSLSVAELSELTKGMQTAEGFTPGTEDALTCP